MTKPAPDLAHLKPDDSTVDEVERMLARGASFAEIEAVLFAQARTSREDVKALAIARIWFGWSLCELHLKGDLARDSSSPRGRLLGRLLAHLDDSEPTPAEIAAAEAEYAADIAAPERGYRAIDAAAIGLAAGPGGDMYGPSRPGKPGLVEVQIASLKPSRFAPVDFKPLERHCSRAEFLALDLDAEVESFLAHEFERPYANWDRAFDRWLENAARIKGSARNGLV